MCHDRAGADCRLPFLFACYSKTNNTPLIEKYVFKLLAKVPGSALGERHVSTFRSCKLFLA